MRARHRALRRASCVPWRTLPRWISRINIFFAAFSKILILKNLRSGDRLESAQNPEPQGPVCKIFQNKGLAASVSDWEQQIPPSSLHSGVGMTRGSHREMFSDVTCDADGGVLICKILSFRTGWVGAGGICWRWRRWWGENPGADWNRRRTDLPRSYVRD